MNADTQRGADEPSLALAIIMIIFAATGAVVWLIMIISLAHCLMYGDQYVAPDAPCTRPLIAVRYWADPVTKECGLRLDGAIQGSHEYCPAILALPAFEKVRHCWDGGK